MNLSPLTAISPIDGRYQSKTSELQPYFSEFGLIKYRVIVEVEYFIAMVESGVKPLADFPKEKYADLRSICSAFSESDALILLILLALSICHELPSNNPNLNNVAFDFQQIQLWI